MLKTLADRLAEAAAEWLHREVRTDYWGYARANARRHAALDRGEVSGHPSGAGLSGLPRPYGQGRTVRPADVQKNAEMGLTESFAMTPAASVAGFYLAHPEARYFAITKIDRDQLEDWATRCGMEVATAERWLAPLL
jgi:5-methyltetrahydrofolate--homocysteine methyltransferase